MASTTLPDTSLMDYCVKEEPAESCAETFVETFPSFHVKEDGSSITAAADVYNTITEDSAETFDENFPLVNVKEEASSSDVSDVLNPIKQFKDAAETFSDDSAETFAGNFHPYDVKEEDSSSEVADVFEEFKDTTETLPDNFHPVHVKEELSSSMAAEPEPGQTFPAILDLSRKTNIYESNIREIVRPIVKEQNDHPSRNTEGLELIVEEHNHGQIFREELPSPSVKEEHMETSTQGNVESDEKYGTVINTNNATSCERSHDSAPLSNGPSFIEMNNGIYSVTFLCEGTEFGPYPDASSTSVRLHTGDVNWPSSMRKSCGKEQHNIEAVRREGQIYYKTVTDIWPNAEIILGGIIEHNMQPVTFTVPEKSHQCLVCKKQFASSRNLRRHIMIHTGEKPHQCLECGKKFAQKNHLQHHNMTHTGEKPHKCLECGSKFASSSHLKQHSMTHSGEKPHECLECGKQFILKGDLNRHNMIHTGEKLYKCQECDKQFLLIGDLKRHNMIHTGQKPHKCLECGKHFISISFLKRHNMIHTGERPYKCQECGKQFRSMNHLKCHNMTHTGEKPYKCQECDKGFINKHHFKAHAVTHADEKPYK